jgi:hypothetical protein
VASLSLSAGKNITSGGGACGEKGDRAFADLIISAGVFEHAKKSSRQQSHLSG